MIDPNSKTGNGLRDKMIAEAISNVRSLGGDITLVDVSAALPEDFSLTADELAMFNAVPAVAGTLEVVESADKAAPAGMIAISDKAAADGALDKLKADHEAANLRRFRGDPDGPAIEAAQEAVRTLTDQLAQLRGQLTAAQRAANEAERERSRAITAFQSGLPNNLTATEHLKQHAAEQVELRRAMAEGRIPEPQRPQPGNSLLDRIAAYSKSSDAEGRGNGLKRGGRPTQTGAAAVTAE
jgi:hypothetical protein